MGQSSKKQRRTTEYFKQLSDLEIAKRVQAVIDRPKTSIKIMDCEFCLHRRFSDNWCMKHDKEIFPKHLACGEFVPGGPDETARR